MRVKQVRLAPMHVSVTELIAGGLWQASMLYHKRNFCCRK
jgi:hypothetical protein